MKMPNYKIEVNYTLFFSRVLQVLQISKILFFRTSHAEHLLCAKHSVSAVGCPIKWDLLAQ